MFKAPEENEADRALRRGLRSLPVPALSADFDARVRAALRRPTPWWQRLWTPVRPVLSMAACSCGVTLALLHWFTAIPLVPPGPSHFGALDAVASARGRARLEALDRQIDGMELSTATLRGLSAVERPPLATQNIAPPAPPEPRHAAPERRSQLATPPTA